LPRSASRYQNVKIGTVFLVGPQQMELGAQNILVLIYFASAFQVFYRRRIWVTRVKLADRIVTDVSLARFPGAF
jgi:hypothetical protein